MEQLMNSKIKGKVFDPCINLQEFRYGGNFTKIHDFIDKQYT